MAHLSLEQKRKGLIAKIKVAQTQLQMDDNTYRAVLMRVTGINSCAKMTLSQLQEVAAEMERLGFQPTRRTVSAPKLRKTSQVPMLDKIAALLSFIG